MPRGLLLAVCMVPLLAATALAHNGAVDSLERAFAGQSGRLRAQTGLQLAREYATSSYQKCRYFTERTLELARTGGFADLEIKALQLAANSAYIAGEDSLSVQLASRAMDLTRRLGDPTMVAWTTFERALDCLARGRHHQAYQNALEAVRIWEALGDMTAVIRVRLRIVEIHLLLGQLSGAEQHLTEAAALVRRTASSAHAPYLAGLSAQLRLRQGRIDEARRSITTMQMLARQNHDLAGEAQSLALLGDLHLGPGRDHTAAIGCFVQACSIADSLDDMVLVGSLASRIARCHQQLGRYEDALRFHLRALEARRAINNVRLVASSRADLGELFMCMHDDRRAEDHLLAGYALVRASDFTAERKHLAECLHELYEARGDYRRAMDHLDDAVSADAEMRAKSGELEIATLEYRNELQRKSEGLTAAIATRQRATFILLMCSLVFIVGLSLAMVYTYLHNRAVNERLLTLNRELDDAVQLRTRILENVLTESTRDQERLTRSEDRFRAMMEMSPDIFTILGPRGEILYNSPAATRIHGYEIEEMLSMDTTDLMHPEDLPAVVSAIEEGMRRPGQVISVQFRYRNKDGSFIWMEATGVNQSDNPAIGGIVAVSRDISDRKRTEMKLFQALKEKDILLGEIHHRVKNNLQILTTMINLQVNALSDSGAIASLREIQGRIMSISLIHEMLYQSGSIGAISLEHYLKSLASSIITATQNLDRQIRLDIDVDDLPISIDAAIPCGLIVNELITNSCKYAFAGFPAPMLRVSAHRIGDRRWHLEVADNGIGLPADIDPLESRTLGLRMVRILGDQLHGRYTFDGSAGTCFTMEFTEPEYLHRHTLPPIT